MCTLLRSRGGETASVHFRILLILTYAHHTRILLHLIDTPLGFMASSRSVVSTPKYALEGTKISIDFIAKLADGMPIPVKAVLVATQAIIALVEVSKV